MSKPSYAKTLDISLTSREVNNLYRPNSIYKSESFVSVHVQKGFCKKFAHILLKEWFFLLKPGGRLFLEYEEKGGVDFNFVESQLWWLFHGNYTIEDHIVSNSQGKLIVTKRETQFAKGDSINKWTFGIITNGERDDWLEEIIASIRVLKIPQYEIIVCGKYKDRKESNFIYIDFNERADKGWISKKKNLICERASFENLCIIHDRIVFDKNWYIGMKRYGNAFELLGCVQIEKSTGELAGDWITLGGPIGTMYKISRLYYDDWDYNVYIGGMYTVMKKSVWKRVLWDETRYWNGAEDADISFRARDLGYIIRFNPYSKCIALAWRHGKIPLKYDFSKSILPQDMILRRVMRSSARVVLTIPLLSNILSATAHVVTKSRVYRYLAYH